MKKRNDDFDAIEAYRKKTKRPVKAIRRWRGDVKFACANSEQANNFSEWLMLAVRNSKWAVGAVGVTDNIVLAKSLTYTARSANADDAERLVTAGAHSAEASIISPIAVKTLENIKLSDDGR